MDIFRVRGADFLKIAIVMPSGELDEMLENPLFLSPMAWSVYNEFGQLLDSRTADSPCSPKGTEFEIANYEQKQPDASRHFTFEFTAVHVAAPEEPVEYYFVRLLPRRSTVRSDPERDHGAHF